MKQASRRALNWLLTLAICLGMASAPGLNARADADEPELVPVNGVTFARVASADMLKEALANIGFCTKTEAYDWVNENSAAVSAFLSQTASDGNVCCIFAYVPDGQCSGIFVSSEGEIDDKVWAVSMSNMADLVSAMNAGVVHVYCVTSKPDYELPDPDAYSFVRVQPGPLAQQLTDVREFTQEEASYLMHSPAFLDALNATKSDRVVFVYAVKDGYMHYVAYERSRWDTIGEYTFADPLPYEGESLAEDELPVICGVLRRSERLLTGLYYEFCTVVDGRVVRHMRQLPIGH